MSAMATTLVTFLFDCQVPARTVEILGSWDNFNRPYHLKRDPRRRIWSGCFTFSDIICDGDPSNLSPRRNGHLKVGGTYWYYYKINQDEEHHNPSQPSTTFCPLLPGQRLNILEIPMESGNRSRSSSQTSDVFTRIPEDRYLTPVPPKIFAPSRLGDRCAQPYTIPRGSLEAPRPATHSLPRSSLSPESHRRARSASASPRSGSNTVFMDFKGLKEKVASSIDGRGRSGSRGARELQIGAPVLISTTAEDMNLVPLPSAQIVPAPAPVPSRVAAHMREFSPLGSHPVEPTRDLQFQHSDTIKKRAPRRPRSHNPCVGTSTVEAAVGRIRANSADARRTKHYHLYSNEPWCSTPGLPKPHDSQSEPAPALQRPSLAIELPATSLEERPSSRRGRRSPSPPVNKDLPALPRYLVPAPLFACNSTASSPVLEGEQHDEALDTLENNTKPFAPIERQTHISTWSADSMAYSSEDEGEGDHSPTFSSFTSDSSLPSDKEDDNDSDSPSITPKENTIIPPILRLELPSFGPETLGLDIHQSAATPNRRAACFGYPNPTAYCSPVDETAEKSTVMISQVAGSETSMDTGKADAFESANRHNRVSSVSQLEKLVSEFGFLGGAVL